MNLAEIFYAEQAIALTSFPVERDKWRKCNICMAHASPFLMAHLSQDSTIDLLLRKFESEIPNPNMESDRLDFAVSQYLTMSRYWILSMYENIRTYGEILSKASNSWNQTEFGIQFSEISELFSLVRVPLAKLEIKGSHKKNVPEIYTIAHPSNPNDKPQRYERIETPYLPIMGMDFSTGSVHWDVITLEHKGQRRISRRLLSDRFLDLFSHSDQASNSKE